MFLGLFHKTLYFLYHKVLSYNNRRDFLQHAIKCIPYVIVQYLQLLFKLFCGTCTMFVKQTPDLTSVAKQMYYAICFNLNTLYVPINVVNFPILPYWHILDVRSAVRSYLKKK